jgi:signal transduction histidine kinase
MSSSTDDSPRPDPASDGTGVDEMEQRRLMAIGRLAGALAHEFNNHLTAILGYASLLLDELGDHPARADLLEIRRSGERAAGLTRQLLTFNRGRQLEPQLLSLPALVEELEPVLKGILGERVALETDAAPSPDVIARRADAGHLLFALALAASDALTHGGTFRVRVVGRPLGDGRAGCLVLVQLCGMARGQGSLRLPGAVTKEVRALCDEQDAALAVVGTEDGIEIRVHYRAADDQVDPSARRSPGIG